MLRSVTRRLTNLVGFALVAALAVPFGLVGRPDSAAAGAQTATVILVPREDYGGMIVTDPDGWTLYTWDGDAPAESWCYDACAEAWPPYTITGELVAPDDLPVSLGLIDRGDGTWQVTLDNYPLYYFIGDAQPGDVAGEGSMGFGARWYVNVFVPEEPTVVFVPQPAPPAPPAPALPPAQPAPPVATAPPVVAMPAATPVPSRTVNVAIVDNEFRPATLNVQVGDTVVWTNNGRLQHTVTSDTGGFDSGRLGPGQTFSRAFSTAGTYRYHCALHPNMRGVVAVGTTAGPVGGPGGPPIPGQFGPGPFDDLPFYGPGFGQPPYAIDPGPYGSPPFPPVGVPPQPQMQQTSVGTVAPNGSISLTWAPVPGSASYRVYAAPASSPLNLTVVHTVSQGVGTPPVGQATVAGLDAGTTYHFQVRAVSVNGLETVVPSATIGGGPLLPTGPLTVTSTTSTTVVLDWPPLPGAVSFRVMQSSSPGGPWSLASAGTVTDSTATVTGLSPASIYYFHVIPVDALGQQGPPTNTVTATTATAAVLTAPTGVVVGTPVGGQVTVSWVPVSSASTYRVMVSSSPNGPFVQAIPISSTSSSATFAGLTPNTTYYIQVHAVDAAGNVSPPSATVTLVTGP